MVIFFPTELLKNTANQFMSVNLDVKEKIIAVRFGATA